MKYDLKIERQARKNLKKLDPPIYRRLITALTSIQTDPSVGKPLSGPYAGSRSYRVGAYRIVYKVYESILVVLVIELGHRGKMY